MAISAKKQIFIVMISVTTILSFIIITFTAQWSPALAQNADINLLGQNSTWRPFSAAIVSQNDTSLEILVVTDNTDKLWNRAYLPIRILSSTNSTNSSVNFTLEYASKSYVGNASFLAEVRDNSSNAIIWSFTLNNTNGQLFNKSFNLPSSILNKVVEVRFYVASTGPGEHTFQVQKAIMSLSNVTQPIKVEYY